MDRSRQPLEDDRMSVPRDRLRWRVLRDNSEARFAKEARYRTPPSSSTSASKATQRARSAPEKVTEAIDAGPFKALVRDAVALNTSAGKQA
jgi:hypothetical protein